MKKSKNNKMKAELNELMERNKWQERKIVELQNDKADLEHQIETMKLRLNSYEGIESAVNKALRESISNLMEIIRWKVNPRTTEFPFEIEKTQRDELNRGRGGFNCSGRPY